MKILGCVCAMVFLTSFACALMDTGAYFLQERKFLTGVFCVLFGLAIFLGAFWFFAFPWFTKLGG